MKYSRVQFFLALTVAALHEMWQQAVGIKRSMAQKEEVPPEQAEARMKVCRACPVYSSVLSTCGTPFRKSTPDTRGCFCYMKAKVNTACNCWAYDRFRGEVIYSWPLELNSFPIEVSAD